MTSMFEQTLRFGAVGAANTAVGLAAIYAVMFVFQATPATANAVGYAIGLSISFMLNRSWTFGSKRALSTQLPKFLIVAAVSYVANLSVVLIAISALSVGPYVAQAAGIAVYTVCFFVGSRWFAFSSARAPA